MADVIRFLGAELEVLILTELDGNGAPLSGGRQWVTAQDIDAIEIENDQEDRERYTVPNANRRFRRSVTRQAQLFGKVVRISFIGESPFADIMLIGSRPNVNGDSDITGYGEGDYECKYVSVEFVAKGLGDECVAAAGGRAWRVFGKVGSWGKTQATSITNGNEVGVTIYEGVGVKNPNFAETENGGNWLTLPATFDPENEYSSFDVNEWEIPEETDGFADLPVTDSSS